MYSPMNFRQPADLLPYLFEWLRVWTLGMCKASHVTEGARIYRTILFKYSWGLAFAPPIAMGLLSRYGQNRSGGPKA
jgi:hypothetical protein